MRGPLIATLVVFLAGCSEAPAPTESVPGPPPVYTTPPLLQVVDGTFQWHEVQTTPSVPAAMVAYDIVTQSAVNPCIFDSHVYFNNRPIPTNTGEQRARTGNLTVTMDWTDLDYPQPTLVLAYKAPGMSGYRESERLARGQETTFRITVEDHSESGSWALAACLNREGSGWGASDWQPGPFLGAFSIHAEFQGDPELPLKEKEDEGRMSRSG